jgi:rhamnosyltransferase
MTIHASTNSKEVRLAGVVVLYHPPASVIENIETYLRDVEVLFVFDNSPIESEIFMKEIFVRRRVRYRTLGKNVGIAAALNAAASEAMNEGYQYLLTMDQDSSATPGMLQKMLDQCLPSEMIGLITPFHQDRNVAKALPEQPTEPTLVAMMSGNVLSLEAYKQVGGFNEQLFIDYVDTEYCLRLHMHGYSVVRCNRAVLNHSLGKFTTRKFLWKTVYPYNHGPLRLYYQTRNRFFLRRLYGKMFPEYFRYDIKLFLGGIVKIVFFEHQSAQKLFMILRGYFAFRRNDFSIITVS